MLRNLSITPTHHSLLITSPLWGKANSYCPPDGRMLRLREVKPLSRVTQLSSVHVWHRTLPGSQSIVLSLHKAQAWAVGTSAERKGHLDALRKALA